MENVDLSAKAIQANGSEGANATGSREGSSPPQSRGGHPMRRISRGSFRARAISAGASRTRSAGR